MKLFIFDKASLSPRMRWALVAVLLLALAVRLPRIGERLPGLYHPDEPKYVQIAQDIIKTGDLNPHFFNYPSLFFYINAAGYIPYHGMARIAGWQHSRADIPAPVIQGMGIASISSPGPILLARGLSILAGVGSVLLLFLIGWRFSGKPWVGLFAALMLALSPTHISSSTLALPDVFLVFFLLLAFWFCQAVMEKGRVLDYVLAGIAIGLTGGAKYNGALIGLSLIAAHFLRQDGTGWKSQKIYLALLICALAFLMTTPYSVFNFSEFLSDFRDEASHYASGHWGMEGDSLQYYLVYLFKYQTIPLLFALNAVYWHLRNRDRRAMLTLVFPVIYFVLISTMAVRNPRTLLPVLPFLFLFGASGVGIVLAEIKRRRPNLLQPLALILILLCLVPPGQVEVQRMLRDRQEESQQVASRWVSEHIPAGAKIALESYGPPIDPDRYQVEVIFRMVDHTAQWYRDQGFDYLVFSQGSFRRFTTAPDRYPEQAAAYEALFQAFPEIQRFDNNDYLIRIHANRENEN